MSPTAQDDLSGIKAAAARVRRELDSLDRIIAGIEKWPDGALTPRHAINTARTVERYARELDREALSLDYLRHGG